MQTLNDDVLFYVDRWKMNVDALRFPSQSISDTVGLKKKIIPHDTALYVAFNQLFAALIAPRSAEEYEVNFKEEVIFPTLYSKNVLIRRPNKDELLRIQKKLYVIP